MDTANGLVWDKSRRKAPAVSETHILPIDGRILPKWASALDVFESAINGLAYPFMHEVGVMESAMDTVLAKARELGANRVHRIVLRVGTLCGVDPDSLRFAFEIVAKGTAADGAELTIDTVQARARCPECGIDFGAEAGFIFSCPKCSRLCGELRQGRELELSRIEMS